MKKGWVTVNGESLSPFHRQLIATFPHYASAAVVECALPASPDVLPYEERALLPSAWSSTPKIPPATGGSFLTPEMRSRIAPVIHRQPIRKTVERKLYFRHAGKKGDRVTVRARPKRLFRGETISVTDSLKGRGTRITSLLSYQRPQYILIFNSHPSTEDAHELLRGVKAMDTCDRYFDIVFTVLFEEDCEFSAIITGKALDDVGCSHCINTDCQCSTQILFRTDDLLTRAIENNETLNDRIDRAIEWLNKVSP